jgi:hypothetical protein
MSEQQAEQSSDETGSLGAGSAVPNTFDQEIHRLLTLAQGARSVEAPNIVPDQDAAKIDDTAVERQAETVRARMPKAEPFTVAGFMADALKPDTHEPDVHEVGTTEPDTAKPDTPESDTLRACEENAALILRSIGEADASRRTKGDAPQADGPKADALRSDRPNEDNAKADAAEAGARPRELLIVAPDEDTWQGSEDRVESGRRAQKGDAERPSRGRRLMAMSAMLALAVIAGAAGGTFATLRLSSLTETTAAAAPDMAALEASVARIDSDIAALKAGLERTSIEGITEFKKTSDRLERIEKAQAEPAAKLAKLSDAVDKLRAAAPAPAPVATVAPKDVTGTVTTPAGAQPLPASPPHAPAAVAAPGNAPAAEVGRLPTVENWVLRDVSHGSALIEGRYGLYEVFAGDSVPGLGRVEAVRKQDGRWVVVTAKGLIVAR